MPLSLKYPRLVRSWLPVVMLLGAVALLGTSCLQEPPAAAAPVKGGGAGKRAVPVTVATAVRKPVSMELNTFGTVQAKASVAVRSQVSEKLLQVHIEKGQKVESGALLFTLESRPFEIELQKAQSTLARDRVLLANAKLEAERFHRLVETHVASQTEADTALATAAALAETLKVDESIIASLELDVQHCRITAPIAGRAGNLMVHAGNLVKANDVPLVVLNQISPIDVFFAVPQRDLERIRAHLAQGELKVTAALPEAAGAPESGTLTFIDNAVDPSSGTIQLGASFPNAAERLWPGQYVRLCLYLTVQQDAIVVPVPAVQTGNAGKYVFVLTPEQTVELRPVTVGTINGADAVITSGVQPGDVVVTDGHLQLKKGSAVEVRTPGGSKPEGASGGEGKHGKEKKEKKEKGLEQGSRDAEPATAKPAPAPQSGSGERVP